MNYSFQLDFFRFSKSDVTIFCNPLLLIGRNPAFLPPLRFVRSFDRLRSIDTDTDTDPSLTFSSYPPLSNTNPLSTRERERNILYKTTLDTHTHTPAA